VDEGKHPKNTGSYFGYIDEAQYLNGVVAGHMSKSKKLGFVAAKPIPQVLRNINAFTMGARSVDPKITTTVIFTGDWSMPVKEAEATNSLADQGVDVFTMHVDGPKVVVETAARAARWSAATTPARPSWRPSLPDRRRVELAHRLHAHRRRRAHRQAAPQLRARRAEGRLRQVLALRRDGQRRRAQERRGGAREDDGRHFDIFAGELKDNTGKVVIAKGKVFKQTDLELEGMNYLVEGVIGKA
jgi:basic membrane protein A and related proteins